METIFSNCTFNKKTVKTPKINCNSERELKRLEKQLNEHLKTTKGKNTDRVRLNNFVEDQQYNQVTMNDFIDREISSKYANKKWSTLPLSLKWSLIKDYASEKKLDVDTINTFKSQLTNGKIDVEYDNKQGKIMSINSI
jgi:transposase